MFKIIEGDFKNNKYSNEEYLDNWPMLYILENGKKAYIGESNHVKTRMTQHATNEEKRIFNKVHFIYSRLFNQSVTFDYESKLIQYIVADELFQVTNKNSGIADKQYYEKEKYDKKFELLWRKLQKEKLVKHSLEEIENSDLFKYSPYKELNDNQRKAVEDILAQIESGNVNRVVVNGMPGSGKTIVAVYLMKYLADSEEFAGKKIGFVVPQTSLRKTMKFIFRSIYGLTPSQVLSPSDITKKKYDILLVDEAHRLHQYKNISYRGAFKKSCERLGMTTDADELDWILEQSKCAVLFYDYNQVVGPSGIDYERFEEKMRNPYKKHTISYFTLATQMRVQGGNDYIAFIKDLLAGAADRKYHSKKYDLKLYSDFSKFEKDMYAKEEETGLSRMVAGYAWPWISKNDRSKKDIEIQGVKRMWNHCSDEPMTEYEIYSYEAYRRKYQDDIREVPRVTLMSLDQEELNRYVELLKRGKQRLATLDNESIYELMSIKRGEKVTLSATLLFSPYPQAYFPQLCITAIVIPGRTIGSLGDMGERFSDNQRIEGTIPEMLDEALLFVKRNMRTKTIISPTTGRRTDRTDYPITAVREAIINALVHRDYSIHTEGMPIQLIMFEDRIEIHNPGGLYGRITIDQLGKIQPDTRNPVLASALETLGITENRYSGIPTIRMEMEKYNLRQPEFLDERGSFIVKLYKESKNDYEDMSNDEETNNLIVFCKTPRTRKEICDYLGLNSVTYAIQTYVNPLVEAGVIKLSIPDKPKSPKQLYYSVEREE